MLQSGQDDGRLAAPVPVPHPVQPEAPPEGTSVLGPGQEFQARGGPSGGHLQEPAAQQVQSSTGAATRWPPANRALPLPWTPQVCVLAYLCGLGAAWRDGGSRPSFSISPMKATLCFSSSGRSPRSDSTFTCNHPSQP